MIDAPAFREHINSSPAITAALAGKRGVRVYDAPEPLRPVTVREDGGAWVVVALLAAAVVLMVGWRYAT